MDNKTDIRKQAARHFVEGALKERFLASPEKDKANVDAIIRKIHAAEAHSHRKANPFRSWRLMVKGFAMAASVAIASILCVHFIKGAGGHDGALRPFLLTSGGCQVFEGLNTETASAGARKLNGDEELNSIGKGSAFVIFPDLVKLEMAAGGSLRLIPDEPRKPAGRFPVAQKRELEIANGVFRLDTNATRLTVKTWAGDVTATDAKIELAIKDGVCYGEVVRGTASIALKGKEGETPKVSAGDLFTLGPEGMEVQRKGAKSIAKTMPQLNDAKRLLIDEIKYDNLLIDLLNRNAADVCLRQDTLRKLINAL